MIECDSFNNGGKELVIPSSVKTIADSFLYKCPVFNVKLTLNKGLQEIGDSFMFDDNLFSQDLTFPEGLKNIGSYCLYDADNFNGKITLPTTLEKIGDSFLYYAINFKQDVLLANTKLTAVPNGFLFQAKSFNGTLTLPKTIETIGSNFLSWVTTGTYQLDLSNCKETLPKLSSIGRSFLYNTAYNAEINFDGCPITTIGSHFLGFCKSFNSALTLPASVTSIGNNFMHVCNVSDQNITIKSTTNPFSTVATEHDECFIKSGTQNSSKFRIYCVSDNVTTFTNYFGSRSWGWNNYVTITAIS